VHLGLGFGYLKRMRLYFRIKQERRTIGIGYLKRMRLYFRIKQERRIIGIGQGLRMEADLCVLPARSSRSTTDI
jgi:hypothetical protein